MEYIFDCITSGLKKQAEEKTYRIYLTDALRVISENTATLSKGKYIPIRYCDMVYNTHNEQQRSSEDIISSVKENLRRMRGENSECV